MKNDIEVFPEGNIPFLIPASRLGRSLRVKFGIDPTTDELHLGHLVPLWQLRRAQENGHVAVLIMGDTTAMIGDPTGRNSTRPQLSEEKVRTNALNFLAAAEKILLPENLEVHFNSEWLGKMDFAQMLVLLSDFTVAQLLTRNDFRQRLDAGNSVGLHELIYGVCQALDSVEIAADVELGGQDQLLNLMLGRDLQEHRGLAPQVCVTVPLLVGTDGKEKMSKSLGNHIPLHLDANDFFGRIMSFGDEPLPLLLEFLTDFDEDTKNRKMEELKNGRNPMELKLDIAENITARFHGEKIGAAVRRSFLDVHRRGKTPELESMEVMKVPAGGIAHLPLLLRDAGMFESAGAVRRLIKDGGMRLGEDVVNKLDFSPEELDGKILRMGKRRFIRLVKI
jgi:tyrosyl-tRNA synthetase